MCLIFWFVLSIFWHYLLVGLHTNAKQKWLCVQCLHSSPESAPSGWLFLYPSPRQSGPVGTHRKRLSVFSCDTNIIAITIFFLIWNTKQNLVAFQNTHKIVNTIRFSLIEQDKKNRNFYLGAGTPRYPGQNTRWNDSISWDNND